MGHTDKLKKYSYLTAISVLALLLVIVLRGPHISNALKKAILPELEAASGTRFIADKIYVNIFPLFVEAKNLKSFDDDGKKIFAASRVKAYLDIAGIFDRSITIRRLVIKSPDVNADEERIGIIRNNIISYLAKQRKDALNVKVLAVEVQQGKAHLESAAKKLSVDIDGLSGEAILNNNQRIDAKAAAVHFHADSLPDISASASAQLLVKDGRVIIRKFEVDSLGSRAVAKGDVVRQEIKLSTYADLLVSSFKKLFGLKQSGEGHVKLSGSVEYTDQVLLDIETSGDIYLETLMELLKVDEKLSGRVEFKGQIKGPLKNIKADGTATMTKGNLYDVEIDSVNCKIMYEKGRMSFLNGDGRLYHGRAKASASIALPVVNHFTLDIAFQDADSKPLFKLIGWDPGVPAGKVSGSLKHEGEYFSPKGDFFYRAVSPGDNVLGRVKQMTGRYDLTGQILQLSDIDIRTDKSSAEASGRVDLSKKLLDINTVITTTDINDASAPYYNRLSGSAEFRGRVSGGFDDPLITGKIKSKSVIMEAYPAEDLTADISYRKDLLKVNDLSAGWKNGDVRLSGSIAFRGARQLFDFSDPLWSLNASLRNMDSEKFVKIFYPGFSGNGRFSSSLRLEGSGKLPTVKASVTMGESTVYGAKVDSGTFNFRYALSRLDFTDMNVRLGTSNVSGSLTIFPDDTFSYKASSDRIRLSDILRRPLQGEVTARLSSEGKGKFDNPELYVNANILNGLLKGKPTGTGTIAASVKNHEFSVKAKLINDRINISASGRTDGIMPWEASGEVQTGRYDFLISSVLKDVPEDLILSLNGSFALRGTKNHIAGNASIKNIVLSMYGYSFNNEGDIVLGIKDRELSIGTSILKSGDARLKAEGSINIGKSYNLNIEGQSGLSPFKSLSAKLGVLKGDAGFVIGISGDWDRPKINGGINLTNGSIGLKDYPSHRITSLAGYLYLDNDKVVLRNLNGKFGGGDVALSGVLYLKRFAFSRFYVEASLNNITSLISNEFSVNFDGSVLYKGTPESQTVSGNIFINKARYKERLEWKSWLLQSRKEKLKTDISNLEKASLNIKITGKDSIQIDNNVVRTQVSADMVLRGTIYKPVLFGRIETSEGKVFFRNNEFRIAHASADFSDPQKLNPLLTIAADTMVKGYRIKMNLEGQLDHFNMSLSSDPPLKEMDILSLLTVGQTSGATKGLEGGIGAGEATSFVTGKLQDVIEERIRSLTGLDRFQVDPYVSKVTGMVEPRVTVSKRMLGDKMFLTYSAGTAGKEEQLIKIEYFVGKNVSLVGVRDERGIVGGDIKFRFEFK